MPKQLALAFPRKNFFLEMFTRDISLEDCVLDLIDNSIDSLVRTRNIVISAHLLDSDFNPSSDLENGSFPTIHVTFSTRACKVVDTCGGISREAALTDVFNFGHSKRGASGYLGAYGIGLKRALFKIGNHFKIESKTAHEGFTAELDLNKWAAHDTDMTDWTIPLKFIPGAKSLSKAGTSITISELRQEVLMRLASGAFEKILRDQIAQAYALFIDRYVKISLNGKAIHPNPIPLAQSSELEPGKEEFEDDDVKVTLLAGLAVRNLKGEWVHERAGWYVLCNGRVVVPADRTDLTGWGEASPLFHYKYRGFCGVAFFQSDDPLALPWDTTKRGLNQESPVYQRAKRRMSGLARPVLSFLNRMYPSEPAAELQERRLAEEIKPVDIRTALTKATSTFRPPIQATQKARTVMVQFKAKIEDVDRIRKFLRQPSWGASKIGEHTFNHFLKTEIAE